MIAVTAKPMTAARHSMSYDADIPICRCWQGDFPSDLELPCDSPREHSAIRRLILVGFPLNYPDREHVHQIQIPKYFVQSTDDEFGPRPEFTAFYESVPEPKHLDWIEAADHFFKGGLDSYERVIEQIGRMRQPPVLAERMLRERDTPPV